MAANAMAPSGQRMLAVDGAEAGAADAEVAFARLERWFAALRR